MHLVTIFTDKGPYLNSVPFIVEYCISGYLTQMVELSSAQLQIHVFQLHDDGPSAEELDDEELAAANHWILPSSDFAGMWESLIFDRDIKAQVSEWKPFY